MNQPRVDALPTVGAVIEQIAPRLRSAREKKDVSLADLERMTGISSSTLSRLETGQRKPSLELLLPIVVALGVSLEQIVAVPLLASAHKPEAGKRRPGRILIPLTNQPSEPRAHKLSIPAHDDEPHLRRHGGYQWLYVLSGRIRIVLGDQDFVLGAGESAEFDCQTPHWFGAAGRAGAEAISVFGTNGERMRPRTRPTQANAVS